MLVFKNKVCIYLCFIDGFRVQLIPLEVSEFPSDRVQQLVHEYRAMHLCCCKHIVDFYGFFLDDGHLWLAMELMKYGSLRDLLETRK
jgi:serine/threonine protein kinase